MLKLTNIGPSKYQHANGTVIEKRPARRIGRNGHANAGWAIIREGREVTRYSTLKRAAAEVEVNA